MLLLILIKWIILLPWKEGAFCVLWSGLNYYINFSFLITDIEASRRGNNFLSNNLSRFHISVTPKSILGITMCCHFRQILISFDCCVLYTAELFGHRWAKGVSLFTSCCRVLPRRCSTVWGEPLTMSIAAQHYTHVNVSCFGEGDEQASVCPPADWSPPIRPEWANNLCLYAKNFWGEPCC